MTTPDKQQVRVAAMDLMKILMDVSSSFDCDDAKVHVLVTCLDLIDALKPILRHMDNRVCTDQTVLNEYNDILQKELDVYH